MTRHAIPRVRHDPRRRLCTVKPAERITPTMARITLGDDLPGFISAGYDDHLKLFFPLPGRTRRRSRRGRTPARGVQASPMRDYTPRRYDATGELVIDFAIHDAGPATEWADAARPGQKLGSAGRRGSFVVTDDFDWYLLAGDETALPAIGRRLEELRADARAIVVGLSRGRRRSRCSRAAPRWRCTGCTGRWQDGRRRAAAGRGVRPDVPRRRRLRLGGGQIAAAKRLRRHLVVERGLNKAWVKAAGYWSAARSASTKPSTTEVVLAGCG